MFVRDWMAAASEAEREAVAVKAKTSVGYLWQLSGLHRKASPDLAERLEIASMTETPGRVMNRMDVLYPPKKAEAA